VVFGRGGVKYSPGPVINSIGYFVSVWVGV
jgi:hypothetical protein